MDDDEGGYETDEYYDEQGCKVVEIDYSTVKYAGPSVQPPKKNKSRPRYVAMDEIRYTMKDMTPTIRDPRCTSNTELACYWPVYVGNFKDTDVEKYFASHGLYIRWWYRQKDNYFYGFQCKAKLFDMLVYFVSERDAELAIERCHRKTHKGYRLNVFPGREPVYFKEDRSVYAKKMKSGRIFSENFFEKHVKFICQVKVNCVVKFDMTNGALEFERPEEVFKAQAKERMWKYMPVKGKLQKQRFLEKDVLGRIEALLAADPCMLQAKNDKYMKLLLRGFRPFINEGRKYRVVPLRRGPPKKTQLKLLQKKLKRKYGADGF